MDLAVTADLVVAACTPRARRQVRRVLGALPQAPTPAMPIAVSIGAAGRDGRDGHRPAQVQLADTDVGTSLSPALALAALERGWMPVHGPTLAAGSGITVITGPSGSGKTAVALALIEHGATLLAPEWALIGPDGAVVPVPGRLRLRPHHLVSAKAAGLLLGRGTALRAAVVASATRVPLPAGPIRRAVGHRAHLDVDVVVGPPQPGLITRVLMLAVADTDVPLVHEVSTREVARQICVLVQADLAVLAGGQVSSGVDRHRLAKATDRLDDALPAALSASGSSAWTVRHDHPRSAASLGPALAAMLQ